MTFLIRILNRKIKKMDDATSNLNTTCDMLIQIIRHLILLSNVSTNISADAVNSLLRDTSTYERLSNDHLSVSCHHMDSMDEGSVDQK